MKFSSAFKKEFMFFTRTMRMFGVILSIMIFSVADPVMLKGMGALMNTMVDTIEEQSEATGYEIFSEEDKAVFEIFDQIDASTAAAMAVGDFTSTAVIIVLLILMAPSGSEQKKRSIIIPRCAGLTPKMYVTPKFILYPVTAFLSGFLGMFICAGVSSILFEGSFEFTSILLSAVSVGLYIAFVIVLQLTIGICSERPGVAVISVLAATAIIPTMLSYFRVDKFNPFALPSIASEAFVAEIDPVNVGVSLIVTVILTLILYFTTLFVLTARQIDNSGNEAIL
ncbi:MAG: hypothetical protein IJZ65_04090 [Ruminiclostridium sp.]|nr:hypothetical protein [Ruminiclostridium sp.]MBQ8841792.1 hypothetical protein [Ruminiclostridium sp.]